MADSDPAATFTQVARDLQALDIGYLHVIEPGVNGTLSDPASAQSPELASGSFRPIQHDQADLIAYGQLFIANPDLPARFRLNAPLALPQRATFYGGGAAGYTDYPALDQPARQPHAARETQLRNELSDRYVTRSPAPCISTGTSLSGATLQPDSPAA